jgi:hypothetical protein
MKGFMILGCILSLGVNDLFAQNQSSTCYLVQDTFSIAPSFFGQMEAAYMNHLLNQDGLDVIIAKVASGSPTGEFNYLIRYSENSATIVRIVNVRGDGKSSETVLSEPVVKLDPAAIPRGSYQHLERNSLSSSVTVISIALNGQRLYKHVFYGDVDFECSSYSDYPELRPVKAIYSGIMDLLVHP